MIENNIRNTQYVESIIKSVELLVQSVEYLPRRTMLIKYNRLALLFRVCENPETEHQKL